MTMQDALGAMKWLKSLPEKEQTKVMLKVGGRQIHKIAAFWVKEGRP